MARLMNPVDEARRVAAVRAALALHRPSDRSTGPRTEGGKRRMALNAVTHGAETLAFTLAVRYCEAVEGALNDHGAYFPDKA